MQRDYAADATLIDHQSKTRTNRLAWPSKPGEWSTSVPYPLVLRILIVALETLLMLLMLLRPSPGGGHSLRPVASPIDG